MKSKKKYIILILASTIFLYPLKSEAAEVNTDYTLKSEMPIDSIYKSLPSVQKITPDVNSYIASKNFSHAAIEEQYKNQFPKFGYRGGVGAGEGIVIHETANPNSTITNEINYMSKNFENAFVHSFVDSNNITLIHPADYAVWGAGKQANPRFYQIELIHYSNNFENFAKAVNNDAYLAAYMLKYFGLEPSRATSNGNGTIWFHSDVSNYLGGTDHTDPVGYFAKYGYSTGDFYDLVVKKFNAMPDLIFYDNRVTDGFAIANPDSFAGLWSSPLNGSSKVGSLSDHKNKVVSVLREARTTRGTWYQLQSQGKILGWVNENHITYYKGYPNVITSETKVNNQYALVKSDSVAGIWNSPLNGAKKVDSTSSYNGKMLEVYSKAEISGGKTWIQIGYDGKIIGWINKDFVDYYTSYPNIILDEREIKTGFGVPKNDKLTSGIWSSPLSGSTKVADLKNYKGKVFEVIKEAETPRAVWYQIKIDGEIIGWVNKDFIDFTVTYPSVVISERQMSGYAVGNKGTTAAIWSTPVSGAEKQANVSDYTNTVLEVVKEAETTRGTWYQVAENGKVIGWVNKEFVTYSTSKPEVILSEKELDSDYVMMKKNSEFSIWASPLKGAAKVADSTKYIDTVLAALTEAKTTRGTWLKIALNETTVGWINKEAVVYYTSFPSLVLEEKEHSGYIVTKPDSSIGIWSTPLTGATKVADASIYSSTVLEVLKESKTTRGTWYQVAKDGEAVGWINKEFVTYSASKPVVIINEKVLTNEYALTNPNSNAGIWTTPLNGASQVANVSDYTNIVLEAVREAETTRGTWIEVAKKGTIIGWVNKEFVSSYTSYPSLILNEQAMNGYAITNKDSNAGIWTTPLTGATKIANVADYIKTLEVVKKAETTRGSWYQLASNNQVIGWVNKEFVTYYEADPGSILNEKLLDDDYAMPNKGVISGIWTTPLKGASKVADVADYENTILNAIKEVETTRGTWLQVAENGEIIGWINKTFVTFYDSKPELIFNEKDIEEGYANVKENAVAGIWSTPLNGAEKVGSLSNYKDITLEVYKEAETQRGIWYQIGIKGQVIGWVNSTYVDFSTSVE